MRLVIVTTVPETLATILRGQPQWLSKKFEVICITSPGPQVDEIKRFERVKVFLVPMCRGISPLRDLVSILRMFLLLRSIRPDIVHSYTPKAGLVLSVSAFLARVKLRVHTFTGLIFPTSRGVKRFVLKSVDSLICALCTHVVPEGDGVARVLRSEKITTLPLNVIGNGNIAGVDVDYFSPRECVSSECFVFCFIGRLNKDKGLLELVSAFERIDSGAELRIVGGVDESSPVDGVTLAKINKNSSIKTLGFMNDVRSELAKCNVLVLPSYREGFPNVLLQAGAMGKPAIATDVSGSNEIVLNGFNGWIVPPKDTSSLEQAMRMAMELPRELLDQLGLNARRNVVEKYEMDFYRLKLVEFYDGLLK